MRISAEVCYWRKGRGKTEDGGGRKCGAMAWFFLELLENRKKIQQLKHYFSLLGLEFTGS